MPKAPAPLPPAIFGLSRRILLVQLRLPGAPGFQTARRGTVALRLRWPVHERDARKLR